MIEIDPPRRVDWSSLRAPFPWFGGKRRVADVVWRAFGRDVPNYVEPFAGSLAVLLGRPGGPGKIETVNDLDRYVANFWRAVAADPVGVARWADWPVNEADLHARHQWLVGQAEFRERMHTDPDFYDVKIAGWWVWGISQWIGSGWCRVSSGGRQRKRPHFGHAQAGIVSGDLFLDIKKRLRRTRVACGDWRRVLTESVLFGGGLQHHCGMRPCAVFLDPPYAHDIRDPTLYSTDDASISEQVRAWAIEHGSDPNLRIALCGFDGEHAMPEAWAVHEWTAVNGYATDKDRGARERVWLSPHCLPIDRQQTLFQSL